MNKISRKTVSLVRSLMIVTALLFVIAVICLFLGKAWVLAVAGTAALATVLCTNKTYRCPHCSKGLPYISPKGADAGDCPYCGEKIEFED